MSNKVHELLKEFSIRMDDRDGGRDRGEDRSREDDEFNFDLDSERDDDLDLGDKEFDDGDEFDDDEFSGEFGGDEFSGDEFPDGLDDVDMEDGEFGGERKIDITDRLKKLLSRRGETEDDLDDTVPSELNLSDIDDLSRDRGPREFRGHDRASMRGDEPSGDAGGKDRLGRIRRDRGRDRRGNVPDPELRSFRDR